ncbi:MAG: FkbM family methyltransferase [Flavobacteriia bacterium]|jgi:FkbM family methyltransferase
MKHFIFLTIVTIWKVLPFKLFHSKIIRAFPEIQRKLYQDLRYKGVMEIQIEKKSFKLFNPGFSTIENDIFWLGIENGWEKISMKLWIELVKHANTVLDIGANTGVYSLVAATVNNKANVYAFEPVKRTSEIFKQNLELNPNLKIQLVEKAVSNADSVAQFYDLPTDSQYSASLNAEMLATFPNRISYDVETVRLDSFFDMKNQKIDVIKLDVEMHEPEAIEGMIELIKKNHPTFLIEILNPLIAERVQQLLKEIDYLCFSIDEENPPKFIGKIEQSEFHNLLLIKKDKLDQVGLFIPELSK